MKKQEKSKNKMTFQRMESNAKQNTTPEARKHALDMEETTPKHSKRRRTNWTDDAEAATIALWQENENGLRSCRKNRHIYLEMAAKLGEMGYSFSADEVQGKLHNLRTKYRKEKQLVGCSGGSPSQWPQFEKLNSFLGPHKVHNVELLMQDNVDDFSSLQSLESTAPSTSASCEENVPSPSDDVPSTSRAAAKKKETQLDVLVDIRNHIQKTDKKMIDAQAEMISIERERNEILKAFGDVLKKL